MQGAPDTPLGLWCRDCLEARGISRPGLVLALVEHGIDVTFAAPRDGPDGFVEFARHTRRTRLPLRRWTEAFSELRAAGHPVTLINEAVEADIDAPADPEGLPGYRVSAERPAGLPHASLVDDGSAFVVYDDEVIEAIAGLVLDDDPGAEYLGRGRRFEARLEALLAHDRTS